MKAKIPAYKAVFDFGGGGGAVVNLLKLVDLRSTRLAEAVDMALRDEIRKAVVSDIGSYRRASSKMLCYSISDRHRHS